MTEEKCKWAWMMDWCKNRYYAPAKVALWKYAEDAWGTRQGELANARAISSCWYCQLGIGSGRLSLRDVPEPPNWKSTLCKDHLDSVTPVRQDDDYVVCEICQKGYRYTPWNWVLGRQDRRCYCQKCVSSFPTRHLDDDRLDSRDAGERDEEEGNSRDPNPLPPARQPRN